MDTNQSESLRMPSNVPSSSSPKTSPLFSEAPLRVLTPQLTSEMTLEQLNVFVAQLRANRSSQTFRAQLTKAAQSESNAERSAKKVDALLSDFL